MSFNFPSFGGQTSTAQQQPAFGAPATQISAPSTSFGGFGTGPTLSSAAPTFGFGTPSFTSTAPATGGFQFGSSSAPSFGFGTQTSTATSFPGFGLGAPASTSAPSFGFGGSLGAGGFSLGTTSTAASFAGLTTNVISTTTSTPSLGLGGISSTPQGGELAALTSQGKTDSKALKELTVPNEISQHVEEFKKHVKEQKTMKEEVSRGTSKTLEKVGDEVETLKNLLANLANNIQQHSALLHKLKHDSALEIQNAEVAQRTKETPPSLQLDNTAPIDYFFHLVADFEQRMQFYKQQIESAERNLQAMNKQHTLTPLELMDTMKKLYEAFLLLCGRVHQVHSALQNCKDDYMAYRRRVHSDSTDIFNPKGGAAVKKAAHSLIPNRDGSGPSPFGGGSDPLARTISHLSSGIQSGDPALTGSSHTFQNRGSFVAPSSGLASSTSLSFATPIRSAGIFNSPSTSGLSTENRSFQLQSPPPGNKRNKR